MASPEAAFSYIHTRPSLFPLEETTMLPPRTLFLQVANAQRKTEAQEAAHGKDVF